jgi:peptidoglycan hydrolase-like protein with peptidoglycan-binding domain
VLTAALGLSLLTPAPAGAAVLSPEHLVTPGISVAVDDTAHPDDSSAALAATGSPAPRRVMSTEVVKGGDKGARVRWIQRILGVPQTGFFGPATRDAVIRFQEGVGASAGTGIVGPLTQRQLQAYGEAKAKYAAKKAAAARKAALASEAARKAAAARAAAEQQATRSTTRPAPAPSTGGDPTMTAAARGSRAAREAVPFAVWRNSAHARMIVARESGGSCTAVSPSGAYRGRWQMGAPFWRSFGGLTFAPTPDQATCGEQDYVAYRGWIASWWTPWGG